MKPHLLDQEVIDMILRHATECIDTDGIDGLRGHILTLTTLLATIATHDSKLTKDLEKYKSELNTKAYLLELTLHKASDIDNMLADIQTTKAENARLRGALERARSDLFEMVNPSGDIRFRPAIDRIDSALKGGTE